MGRRYRNKRLLIFHLPFSEVSCVVTHLLCALARRGRRSALPLALGRHVDGASVLRTRTAWAKARPRAPQERPLVQSAPRAKSVRHIGSPRDLPSRYG